MKMWFVGETVRNRQDEAALSVTPLGMEAYVPSLIRSRKRGHHVIEEEEPRFGTYIFLRFDREKDRWPDLIHGLSKRKYFQRILCNTNGYPIPVPEKAIQAIMAYKPPRIGAPVVMLYQPGQRVVWTLAGTRRDGVFLEYCGQRPFIRTWMFGADRVTEVSTSELEPQEAA